MEHYTVMNKQKCLFMEPQKCYEPEKSQQLSCVILLINIPTAVTVWTIKDGLNSFPKDYNIVFCPQTSKVSSHQVCRATVILQITCPRRGDSPFTLHLLLFGTTHLTHLISASGPYQMFLNNFSNRWKFLPFAAELVLLDISSNLDISRQAQQISALIFLTWKTFTAVRGDTPESLYPLISFAPCWKISL